ncbi:hypothetical protein SDC9_91376 [bioreactor metagenome]|uniref:Uncharacterized protein n=1 Tax=bioreactor metagenome TaxID=1076179 RepID=A0A644ZUW6_9ZZZZ
MGNDIETSKDNIFLFATYICQTKYYVTLQYVENITYCGFGEVNNLCL